MSQPEKAKSRKRRGYTVQITKRYSTYSEKPVSLSYCMECGVKLKGIACTKCNIKYINIAADKEKETAILAVRLMGEAEMMKI